jgi:hypothetical protein
MSISRSFGRGGLQLSGVGLGTRPGPLPAHEHLWSILLNALENGPTRLLLAWSGVSRPSGCFPVPSCLRYPRSSWQPSPANRPRDATSVAQANQTDGPPSRLRSGFRWPLRCVGIRYGL